MQRPPGQLPLAKSLTVAAPWLRGTAQLPLGQPGSAGRVWATPAAAVAALEGRAEAFAAPPMAAAVPATAAALPHEPAAATAALAAAPVALAALICVPAAPSLLLPGPGQHVAWLMPARGSAGPPQPPAARQRWGDPSAWLNPSARGMSQQDVADGCKLHKSSSRQHAAQHTPLNARPAGGLHLPLRETLRRQQLSNHARCGGQSPAALLAVPAAAPSAHADLVVRAVPLPERQVVAGGQ